MSNPSTDTLDHIVHLTPPGTVQEASEQFRKLGFTVVPGGTHTDGLTANALVVFADGVYLELIAFIHPSSYYPPGSPERRLRDNHIWASKAPGWIDYAFLGNGSLSNSISAIINERARKDGVGKLYVGEERGGRKRPDGEVLKWLVSNATEAKRGILPFFCGDVTPRHLRVPSHPSSNTRHPSTTTGIAHVRVLTDPASLAAVTREFTSVVGDLPISSTATDVTWLLDSVHPGKTASRLVLSTPIEADEIAFVEQTHTGIYEVAFRVGKAQKGAGEKTPYGRIAWVPEE